jgi:hypothetical protein
MTHRRRSSTAVENLKWNENTSSMGRAGFGRLHQATFDGKIKRIFDPRALRSQRPCLHIGFCKVSRHANGTPQSGRGAAFGTFLFDFNRPSDVARKVRP